MIRLIILTCLFIYSNLSNSENVSYIVEVIIFEDATELYKNTENWSPTLTSEDLIENADISDQSIKLNKYSDSVKSDKTKDFQFIEQEEFKLKAQAKKLEENDRYNILYHNAWKQDGLDKKSAIPLSINTKIDGTSSSDDLSATSYITGKFTLIMSRYLHVVSHINLIKSAKTLLTPKLSADDDVDENDIDKLTDIKTISPEQYSLTFERRMRSKEIHYIDHPMGGMIVLAIPYKPLPDVNTQNNAQESYKTIR